MHFLRKPIAVLAIIVVLVSSVAYVGYHIVSKDKEQQMRVGTPVEVEEARFGSLTRQLNLVGNLEADNSVTLKAQVRGTVARVNIRGGEEVRKGDVLFEIDDRTYKAVLKEAEAQHKFAQATFKRAQELKEKNFAAAKSYQEAEANLLKSEAAIEKAQKDLDDTKIKAPFDGLVGLHKVSVGTPISGDLELVTVTDVDPIKVQFKVPARFLGNLSTGQKVKVSVDSYPDREFSGRITEIDSKVDQSAQSVAVIAELNNDRNLLKPGLFVRVQLTAGSADNTLVVPKEAVLPRGDQFYVWRVIEPPQMPGRFFGVQVPVLVGLEDITRVQITRGRLSAGDLVVTVGFGKLRQDGQAVTFDGMAQMSRTSSAQDTAKAQEPSEGNLKPGEKKAPEAPGFFDKMTTKIKGFFSQKQDAEPASPVVEPEQKGPESPTSGAEGAQANTSGAKSAHKEAADRESGARKNNDAAQAAS